MPSYTSLNFLEFFASFPSEETCEEHLIRVRWSHSMRCTACGSAEFYPRIRTRRSYQCRQCRRFLSPTAGTIFHKTRMPLHAWFLAIFSVAFDKRGLSALQLAEEIGCDYDTAWAMLQRIRRAMAKRDSQYRLPSPIEMDDLFIGAASQGTKGRGTEQTPVLVAVSFVPVEEEEYTGFAKMRVVQHLDKHAIVSFAREVVMPGGHIRSDGYLPYKSLAACGFQHDPVTVGRKENAHVLLPHVHTYISNFKSFVQGTYHGLEDTHLQHYIDEYCYRFNRRRYRQELFDRLLLACLEMPETPFSALTR